MKEECLSFTVDVNDYFSIGISSHIDYDFISDFNVIRDFNLNVGCLFFTYNNGCGFRFTCIIHVIAHVSSNNSVFTSLVECNCQAVSFSQVDCILCTVDINDYSTGSTVSNINRYCGFNAHFCFRISSQFYFGF